MDTGLLDLMICIQDDLNRAIAFYQQGNLTQAKRTIEGIKDALPIIHLELERITD